MRDIKFKGKDRNNKWVYGYYYTIYDPDFETKYSYIMTDSGHDYAVMDSTVCECVGIQDSNGSDIYEHDILRYYIKELKTFITTEIVYTGTKYQLVWDNTVLHFDFDPKNATIVGNIFDGVKTK